MPNGPAAAVAPPSSPPREPERVRPNDLNTKLRRPILSSVTLEEAQKHLPELLTRLQPGEEILITDHGQPLAQVKKVERTSWPCKAGSARGKIHLAPDFDAPLEDFKEYME